MRSVLTLAAALMAASCQFDRTGPEVTSVTPADGATNVATNAAIVIAFSEAMDQTATQAAFSLAPVATGSFSWLGNSMTYSAQMAPRTGYTVTMDNGACDLAGNRLAQSSVTTFTTGDSALNFVDVYMLGRSVMGGWFSHWGADPFSHGRFTLAYHELESPPDIVARTERIVDSITTGQNPVVFFKLCFVDFEGGDSATAQANLDRNLGYVQQVYDHTVTGRGLRLIVGNALPQVVRDHNTWLAWNHRQYNQRLLDFAAAHADVKVFDLYSVLSDANGDLRSDYATSSDDSHPNDAGYAALDGPLFTLLEQNY
jgi:hypothetical protein